jgi:hypothetical protein
MGIVFKAPHPIFGRADKPLSEAYQQRSPYYWWWQFLRRNEQYRACCEADGKGELAALYADFGNVVQHDNFKEWWAERGYRLFAEKRKPVKLAELKDASEWDSEWTREAVMVIAVPLDLPKRYLQGFFAKLLKERHSGKRGRKALSDEDASTASYPLHRNVSVRTLRTQLAVYDAVTAKQRGEDKRTLAKIGADLKLVPTAMPLVRDDKITAEDKRNVMTATVGRYFRDARRIVENTAKGQFPNSN